MNDLIPCPDCSRHVRRREETCPFCGTRVAAVMASAPVRRLPTTRLGRAALFTFAAASIGTAACGGDDDGKTSATGGAAGASAGGAGNGGKMDAAGGVNQGGAIALYGAAPLYGLSPPNK